MDVDYLGFEIFLQKLAADVPKLENKDVRKVFLHALKELGVETQADLKHVQEVDLTANLFTTIQARKILSIWKEILFSGAAVSEIEPSPTRKTTSSQINDKTSSASKTKATNPNNFTYNDETQARAFGKLTHGSIDRSQRTITYGDNAQVEESHNTYHGPVDNSRYKTTYGNNAQTGGIRNIGARNVVNNIKRLESKESVHLGIGDINKYQNWS